MGHKKILTRSTFVSLIAIFLAILTIGYAENCYAASSAEILNKKKELNDRKEEYFRDLRRDAEAGSPDDQFKYGLFLLDGRYVKKDSKVGVQFLEKSAKAGNVPANRTLGLLYQKGGGELQKDLKKAETYLKRAAMNGDPEAQYRLWILYAFDMPNKNEKLAKEMLEKSAERRYPPALSDLGRNKIYAQHGYDADVKNGAGLVSLAAGLGDARSMHILAILYGGGKNSPFSKDLVGALVWARLTQVFATTREIAAQGYVLQKSLGGILSEKEVAAAESLFSEKK